MDTANMTANEIFIVVIISALIFAFVSIGISCFVTYLVLNKYNNFGDTSCSLYQYSAHGVSYKVQRDNVLLEEKNDFFSVWGENPYANIERSIPEQLLKNAEEQTETF